MDLESLAAFVKKAGGSDVPVIVCREGLANEYTADNSRLRSELGDFRFTSAEDGIKQLYAYYGEIENTIDLMKLLY